MITYYVKSNYLGDHIIMDHLFPLLLYFACTLLAATFDNMSTGAIVAVAKLDLQYGVAHSSHMVLVMCVKIL